MVQLIPQCRSLPGSMGRLMLLSALFTAVLSFTQPNAIATHSRHSPSTTTSLLAQQPNTNNDNNNSRRSLLQKSAALSITSLLTAAIITTPIPILSAAHAKNPKSRTEGYAIQHSEAEWSAMLSSMQYFVLRQGGTESPYSSILEGEERPGTYACAGCGTPLFNANQKFHSGTGWPSYASPVMSSSEDKSSVSNVEMEDMSRIQYQLAGAEVRCRSCGGHLGDVFADGFLFPGTPALISGKRYCVDGAALVFVPKEQRGGEAELEIVSGDLPPKDGGRRVFQG